MPEPADDALLLDTHVWIWLMEGVRGQMSAGAVGEMREAGERGDILISAISVWEVAMLEAKGRISLSLPVDEWVRRALRAPGTRLLELTPEIAIESTRLPGAIHGDPADRILLASARATDGRLATRDEALLEYCSDGHARALDVTP